MLPLTLSKSDYKLACSCPKKLHYKKLKYPSNLEENEFMKMLAEGGYVVGKLAQLLYPGTEVNEERMDAAVAQTQVLLEQHSVTLHEAAVRSGQKVARIDILVKEGSHFKLIEVKAKSFKSSQEADFKRNKKGGLNSKNEEYIKDAIYQTNILKEAYPEAIIDTFLLMPDKDEESLVEGLPGWFTTKISEPEHPGGYRRVIVNFADNGEKSLESLLAEIHKNRLLKCLDINREVLDFSGLVENETNLFLQLLNTDFRDYHPKLTKSCKLCEYRDSGNDNRNGYKECWGTMAEVSPHIFDLYKGRILGVRKLLDEKIDQHKVSFYDLEESELVNSKGEVGKDNVRQLIQYENSRNNTEFPLTDMDRKVFCTKLHEQFTYPLHFIDFETMASALPFHKGLKPYNMFPFQWSVHTVNEPGAAPQHFEYINTKPGYPGFRFAEALMDCIGESGTPLMWSTHENTTLKNVLRHMGEMGYSNSNLKSWLVDITKETDEKGKKILREGRLVDMNVFARENYFHPDMKGRTSIKVTLPAIWNNNPYLHDIPWFKEWVHKDEQGKVLDPYLKLRLETLPQLLGFLPQSTVEDDEESVGEYAVKDGGAAMKAYQEMIFSKDLIKREFQKNQLLAYCKLDTMAMVIIYTHWYKLANGV